MSTKSINEIQNAIIEDFELFDDWIEKYEYLIDYGKSLPLIDEKYKVDEALVKGCQSKVWLHAEMDGDKVLYKADSDAVITKALVGLMISVLSSHTPKEILNSELYFIDRVGLKEHLSINRSNGLASMVKLMKMYAKAINTKTT